MRILLYRFRDGAHHSDIKKMGIYTKADFQIGGASRVMQFDRCVDAKVAVKPPLPGSVIVIHGVNDVGVAFAEVEKGLCAGLGKRADWAGLYRPANYRMPTHDDEGKLEVDPDAVFFKRHADQNTYSPVIPFYWGYREVDGRYTAGESTTHGQAVDRFGNRLDKDFSKGGGPFANATSTLVDMWNKGFGSGFFDATDKANHDPLRPVLKAPGRMYMVLAAQRLAALISMIRDYDPNETVSIVAHSQGCLISLLAQAFLMDKGLRPADTLVLTHPPYSLVDDIAATSFSAHLPAVAELFSGGEDALMSAHYAAIGTRQTMDARLRTLANIVKGVATQKQTTPEIHALKDPSCNGIVGAKWVADKPERDNRGKVYLYFCPEDMTVSLNNIQGIGWQGVPDFATGLKLTPVRAKNFMGLYQDVLQPEPQEREALKELGPSFFQRVFTARPRPPSNGKGLARRVQVGAEAPFDFALLVEGEDEHAHVREGADSQRASSPAVDFPVRKTYLGVIPKSLPEQRFGIRTITGEKLKIPVEADMYAGSLPVKDQPPGALERPDPIDAAISVTSRYGLLLRPKEQIDDPRTNPGKVVGVFSDPGTKEVENLLNQGKSPADTCQVTEVFAIAGSGKLMVTRYETPDEARLRQQQLGQADRSFHGAIFGSAMNHQNVTAYDVAIGQGFAPSRPDFNAYLCAVADWRLKRPILNKASRAGILTWNNFLSKFGSYYAAELPWRKKLIEGNCRYYSTGALPDCLPVLPVGLPSTVVSETMGGTRIASVVLNAPEKVKPSGMA